MTMGEEVVALGFAVAVGLVSLGIFMLGEYFGKKRQPEFFVDRPSLESKYRFGPLNDVETAHCCWLRGQKAFHAEEDLHKIQQLILPSPDSNSLQNFQEAGPQPLDLSSEIKRVIRTAIDKNINVRLYPEFTGQSWWIGNRDKPDAFVHIECLLPYSPANRRPSFRVYRWQDEDFYQRYRKIFETMWDASSFPNHGDNHGTR